HSGPAPGGPPDRDLRHGSRIAVSVCVTNGAAARRPEPIGGRAPRRRAHSGRTGEGTRSIASSEYASKHVTDATEPAPDRPRGPAVVVAGASAGGVEALIALVRSLPADFPHPMLVVLHVSPTGTSVLPAILDRACRLPVSAPADGDALQPGHVYVAPPDSHLVVEDSRLRLSDAPRERGHRPAIDATMRTAAKAYDGA